MKKQLLALGLLLMTFSSYAQRNTFQEKVSYWVKTDAKTSGESQLNGYAPLKITSDGNFTTPIGKAASNYYLVFKSHDKEHVDLLDVNLNCYKHTMTTRNISLADEALKNEKIQTGAIVKQGFKYDYESDRQFFQLIDADDQTYIYEFIYVNDDFELTDHQKIQTYLSLKYGISLLESSNYYDEQVGYLWTEKQNNQYITSIGRNDFYQLNTLTTVNSAQDIYSLSAKHLNNHEYILVGSSADDWKVGEGGKILKNFSFEATTSNAVDFTFSVNTNDLETANGVLMLYKNNDFTQPIAVGVESGDHQIDFHLSTNDISSTDEYVLAFAQMPSAEIVLDKNAYKIYPNPVKVGESLSIDFNFKYKTDTEIYIYQIDGKLVERKRLGVIDQYQYTTRLQSSGTYVVAIVNNGNTQAQKIVVE